MAVLYDHFKCNYSTRLLIITCISGKHGVEMINPENRLFCLDRANLEPAIDSQREHERLTILSEFELLQPSGVLVFDEATQTAAHFLETPICILGFLDRDRHWFKSAIGLSRIGLMNELVTSRQLLRGESFCTQVVNSCQVFMLNDVVADPVFANSLLAQRYGIRAYLGVPMVSSSGHCLGSLAVMDLSPREFTAKEISFLELAARWSMSEFERNHLLQQSQTNQSATSVGDRSQSLISATTTQSIKTALTAQMAQELCTPLTSILGMASVLTREIYGPLTDKQKEYIGIVHASSQHLLAVVNEVLELGGLDDGRDGLNLTCVDIEMLCQQALALLDRVAQHRQQQIRLTMEPGLRVWLLDKDKVRQILYHLVFNVIHSSSTESQIRVHISRRQGCLNLTLWTSHPWLGDGLPQAEIHANRLLTQPQASLSSDENSIASSWQTWEMQAIASNSIDAVAIEALTKSNLPKLNSSRQGLGLLLSHHLTVMHGGSISIQGSAEAGYRYVISLPQRSEPQTDS